MLIVGIDEVGRGSLAGPMCIGLFVVSDTCQSEIQKGAPSPITDSKQVTEKRRSLLMSYFLSCKKCKLCDFVVMSMSADKIDRYGISACLSQMIETGLMKLNVQLDDTIVLLDGGLKAPSQYKQMTIIKGDASEFAISAASIIAKVYRDQYMKKQAHVYPGYGFETHVGYGTLAHRQAIQKLGLSLLHRKTFCNKALQGFHAPIDK